MNLKHFSIISTLLARFIAAKCYTDGQHFDKLKGSNDLNSSYEEFCRSKIVNVPWKVGELVRNSQSSMRNHFSDVSN